MKNVLLDKGIILPSGEISKDKINLVAGAITQPFAEMVWVTTGGDMETVNRLTDVLVTMNTPADREIRLCRKKGNYELPPVPQLADFDAELQAYKQHVREEIAQEAASAGMTVEEYAANGYEPNATAPEQTEPEEAEPTQEATPEKEAPEQTTEAAPETSVKYYPINEAAARRAKEMNSFSDYKPGSATAEYRHYVDEAAEVAARQKKRVDPSFHEKIDSLLDTYARKLADNMNKGFAIDSRVPSILIAGGSNFPVRKKEKQNAARDRNMEEWREIEGLLDKIRSTGMGGISADDPQAVQKLESKLAKLEQAQETMKAVNAYYRKNKTLALSAIKDRHGVYAQISRDENRDRDIRKPRPSIRAQLKADKGKAAPKKAATKTKNHDLEV